VIRYYTAAEVAHIWRRPVGTVHRLASEQQWKRLPGRARPTCYDGDDVEKTMNGAIRWEPTNWPETDRHGEALDLSTRSDGVFSMRRHGDRVHVTTLPAGRGLRLTEAEALDIAESLLAAVALIRQRRAERGRLTR
jgi:hypothetical protein